MGGFETVVDGARRQGQGALLDIDSPEYIEWIMEKVAAYLRLYNAGNGIPEGEEIVATLGENPVRLKNNQLVHILMTTDPGYSLSIEDVAKEMSGGNGRYKACLTQILSERGGNMERVRPDLNRALAKANYPGIQKL